MSNMPHNDDNNNNCDENGNPLPPGISTAVFRASDDLTGRCLACKLNVGTCNREDIYDAVLKEHGVHCKEVLGLPNNQVRHELYKMATREIHGILQKRERRPLDDCIITAIKDDYPNDKGVAYTGFRAAWGGHEAVVQVIT
jgi:hypothetical protein